MGGLDPSQEQLIGELLKGGAVYEQSVVYPVNYGPGAPSSATAPPNEQHQASDLAPHNRLQRFNDKLSVKYREFVRASSLNINEIKTVKYNPILLARCRGKMDELSDRDMMEILKYIWKNINIKMC